MPKPDNIQLIHIKTKQKNNESSSHYELNGTNISSEHFPQTQNWPLTLEQNKAQQKQETWNNSLYHIRPLWIKYEFAQKKEQKL